MDFLSIDTNHRVHAQQASVAWPSVPAKHFAIPLQLGRDNRPGLFVSSLRIRRGDEGACFHEVYYGRETDLMGDWCYLAPMQFNHKSKDDFETRKRADLWALGIIQKQIEMLGEPRGAHNASYSLSDAIQGREGGFPVKLTTNFSSDFPSCTS